MLDEEILETPLVDRKRKQSIVFRLDVVPRKEKKKFKKKDDCRALECDPFWIACTLGLLRLFSLLSCRGYSACLEDILNVERIWPLPEISYEGARSGDFASFSDALEFRQQNVLVRLPTKSVFFLDAVGKPHCRFDAVSGVRNFTHDDFSRGELRLPRSFCVVTRGHACCERGGDLMTAPA